METKKPKSQTIDNAWPSNFLGVNWLPDNSGITFLHFPNGDTSETKFKQNSQAVIYFLNEDPKDLKSIFGNKTHSKFNINENEYPIPVIKSAEDKYIIGYIAGVDTYWDAYYAKIDDIKLGRLNWKLLHSKKEKVVHNNGFFKGDQFIFLSAKNTINRNILSVTMDSLDFEKPKIVAKEKVSEIINNFEITKDVIYYTTTKHGVEANLYKIDSSGEKMIETPKKAGEISLYTKSINSNDLWVTTRGWVNSNIRYKYHYETNTFIEDNLLPKMNFPNLKI
ncbi:hypothetical protein N7U66_18220 [Lacinutrix neustonica]|uniref:Uncharacterized protein n=1 Tax=Lacinutrix neustonica TaxID=2980107 RepID=A0A9E8MWY6_9FLAO|nr:hypothetical protein [Lacinutrix neustonica]WAC01799.1 hypothetical protein N7U66_18220 [Lacinutrix neustonica]